MKTSAILIILIILNTTVLLSEPVSLFIRNINSWFLVGIEVLLLMGYFIHSMAKQLNKMPKLDFNITNLFVVRKKNK